MNEFLDIFGDVLRIFTFQVPRPTHHDPMRQHGLPDRAARRWGNPRRGGLSR